MCRSKIGHGLCVIAKPQRSGGLAGDNVVGCSRGRGFTLIEMLVAMAITLVMMGAVVTLFANISNSVRNRRATTEMSGQLRQVRNKLQQDLQGATCPGVTWQRPESNHGYIEIIEGQYHEGYATNLIDADPSDAKTWPPKILNPEIDHKASTLPSSNLAFKDSTWATDAAGLGDADDILMLTVRNEHEPFNGRVPKAYSYIASEASLCVRPDEKVASKFDKWTLTDSIRSPLAEVVWFAFENPGYTDDGLTDPTANHFFGEPGMRTIYRRTLLIAPWLNPYRYIDRNGVVTDTFTYDGGTFKAQPGLMRILPKQIALEEAIAAVVAFQDRYDLSVRLDWDGDIQRWKIVANTLGDLTKRENRFCHFGYNWGPSTTKPPTRSFPFQFVSMGSDYSGTTVKIGLANDPELPAPSQLAKATGYLTNIGNVRNAVATYGVDTNGTNYAARPFVFIEEQPPAQAPATFVQATAQAMLNDDGSVVRIVHGPVPLWGSRRGEDVMMTDVLAFDLRVYDPGAPIFATLKSPATPTVPAEYDVVLTPSDPGWRGTAPTGADGAYMNSDNMGNANGIGGATSQTINSMPYVGQGAYVDMGYGYDPRFRLSGQPLGMFPVPKYASSFASAAAPWFFSPRGLSDVFGNSKSPGYCVYDTWSFHYENDGIDEDLSGVVDQATNGLDDPDFRTIAPFNAFNTSAPLDFAINGIDDVGERETTPPYDKPLRGMQALIRTYEHDSRAIRQVRVNQHFMQE
jgi:prepilin-type N-terminal cleavage/methylation domain-containing protein